MHNNEYSTEVKYLC